MVHMAEIEPPKIRERPRLRAIAPIVTSMVLEPAALI